MSKRFVAESQKVSLPEVEVTNECGTIMCRIKYPEPDPKDRIDDEYYTDDDHSE